MNSSLYFTTPDQAQTTNPDNNQDTDHLHKLLGTRFDDDGEINEAKIVKLINSRESDYESLHNQIKVESDRNREFYKGNQIDASKLMEKENPIVVNRILTAVEAIIPIATENTPTPVITITPKNTNTYNLRSKLEKKLTNLWEVEIDMQSNNEAGLRILFSQGFYAIKVFWNEVINDIDAYLIPMNQISFPKDTVDVDSASGIIEYVKTTIGELKVKFPDKGDMIFAKIKQKNPEVSDSSPITYTEYWENEWYACKYENDLLDYDINPNYLIAGNNYFKAAKKPYIFINYLTFGDQLVDDTTLIGQGIPLQNGINRRKRQIELNADLMNGTTIVAGSALTEAQAQEIQNDPQATIYLPNRENATGAVEKVTGIAMPAQAFDDMQDSKEEIDNVMGTHSTTRGEQGKEETALGRQILISRDVGRLGTLFKRLEKGAKEFYEYALQLMYVFYDEDHPVLTYIKNKNESTALSEKTTEDFINRDEFENVIIKILVQQGSATPTDKTNRQANAVDLAKAGLMSLPDMYKELEYSNPETLAKNAIMQKIDPFYLFPEIKNPDEYDIQAIMDIKKITDAPLGQEVNIEHHVNSLQFMQQYLETLTDYKKGMEVDPDLPEYEDLHVAAKMSLEKLMQQVYLDLKQMVQDAQDKMQQQQAQQAAPQGNPLAAIPPQMLQQLVEGIKEQVLQAIGANKGRKDLLGKTLANSQIGTPMSPPATISDTPNASQPQ